MKALILLGSARENRLGDRVSKFMTNQLKARGWEVNILGTCSQLIISVLDQMHAVTHSLASSHSKYV